MDLFYNDMCFLLLLLFCVCVCVKTLSLLSSSSSSSLPNSNLRFLTSVLPLIVGEVNNKKTPLLFKIIGKKIRRKQVFNKFVFFFLNFLLFKNKLYVPIPT